MKIYTNKQAQENFEKAMLAYRDNCKSPGKIKFINEQEYKELEQSPKVKAKEFKGAEAKFARSHTFKATLGESEVEDKILNDIKQLKEEVIETKFDFSKPAGYPNHHEYQSRNPESK